MKYKVGTEWKTKGGWKATVVKVIPYIYEGAFTIFVRHDCDKKHSDGNLVEHNCFHGEQGYFHSEEFDIVSPYRAT